MQYLIKTKNLLFGSLIIGAGLAVALRGAAKAAAVKPVSGCAGYDSIDAYIEQQRNHLNIPGVSLAIVEGDKIAHLRGFGKARPLGDAPMTRRHAHSPTQSSLRDDVSPDPPARRRDSSDFRRDDVSPQTPFFIGSLTKSFTALAVMQLVEAGKVELDAPVQRYLPWFRVADPQASAQMTVRHLLNQTSGLPMSLGLADLANLDSRPDAAERQVRALSRLKLTRPVGSKFEYSNTNYNVLGLIVEVASGECYPEYIQQHILNPLEMRHTYTSERVAQQNGLAMGYRYWFGFPFPARTLQVPGGSLASGQLISCAEDMAHYLIAHLNGGRYGDSQILLPAGIEEMHRPAAEIRELGMPLGHYGMGWISQGTDGARIVSHSGVVPDFGAFMALVPEQNKGMVLLFNVNHAMMKLTFDEMGKGAAQRLAGQPPAPTRLDAVPWAMRGMLLIPILQIVGTVATLLLLRRWRTEPALRPTRYRMWGKHILLPLIPDLLAALTIVPMLSKMRGFINLFMPDYAWLAMICGSFAVVWSFLRTALVIRALRKS